MAFVGSCLARAAFLVRLVPNLAAAGLIGTTRDRAPLAVVGPHRPLLSPEKLYGEEASRLCCSGI